MTHTHTYTGTHKSFLFFATSSGTQGFLMTAQGSHLPLGRGLYGIGIERLTFHMQTMHAHRSVFMALSLFYVQ